MPFCPNCGKEVSEDMEFCPECGQRLKQGFTLEERNKYIEEFKASVEGGKPPKKTEITLRVFPIDVRGIWIYHYYDMYFTNKRIVANAVGQGENARATTMATSVFPLPVLLERMYEKKGPFSDAEQILKADKKNFAWDYKAILFRLNLRGKPAGGEALQP
ncbi:hypothetical protein ES706_01716 [subsurface metagenome]